MNNDSFLLVTRQPVKGGTGFVIASVSRTGIDSMIYSALIDSYINTKVAMSMMDNPSDFDSEYAENIIELMKTAEEDKSDGFKRTLEVIAEKLPVQVAEVDKLFLAIRENKEFYESFLSSHKTMGSKFTILSMEEPCSKTRPLFLGLIQYKKIIETLNSNPLISFQDKQKTKEELDKSLRYAAQLSSLEKFVAWASLQNKKSQEASNPKDTTKTENRTSPEEGEKKETAEDGRTSPTDKAKESKATPKAETHKGKKAKAEKGT